MIQSSRQLGYCTAYPPCCLNRVATNSKIIISQTARHIYHAYTLATALVKQCQTDTSFNHRQI
ncbi:hypothetical protein B0189_00360 [Moraxella cuniculi]|nr:hypothetical protein B0189_00360 [Moraxella cuniculi]